MRCLVIALAACGSQAPPPAPPAPPPPHPAPDPASSDVCVDNASLDARRDALCTVTGRYTLKSFPGKGGKALGPWPIVTLADGTDVMIESLWYPEKRPDDAAYLGKRVVISGVVRTSPPREWPANFGHWTLSPVMSIAVAP